MKKTPEMKTIEDLLAAICKRIGYITKGFCVVILVFDSYKKLTFKSKTRQKRAAASKTPCRDFLPNLKSKLMMSLKELLSSSVTKAALVPLVVGALQNYFKDKEGVSLTAVYEDTIMGLDSTDSQTHEEADTAIPNQVQ